VFDAATFERLYKRIESCGIPLLVGVWPFESVLDAEFMANEVPGVRVPDQVLERMRGATNAEAAAAQGIAIARETVNAIRGMVQGVHIAAPGGRTDAAAAVLDGIAASA
jgi:methionine synthase / methylenetetrahydrofolate reductase (NADH)